jgi:hypothetical protein
MMICLKSFGWWADSSGSTPDMGNEALQAACSGKRVAFPCVILFFIVSVVDGCYWWGCAQL